MQPEAACGSRGHCPFDCGPTEVAPGACGAHPLDWHTRLTRRTYTLDRHAGPTRWTDTLDRHAGLTGWADTLWLTLHRTRDGLTMPMSEPCPCPNHAHVPTMSCPNHVMSEPGGRRRGHGIAPPIQWPTRRCRFGASSDGTGTGPTSCHADLSTQSRQSSPRSCPAVKASATSPRRADFRRHFAELF